MATQLKKKIKVIFSLMAGPLHPLSQPLLMARPLREEFFGEAAKKRGNFLNFITALPKGSRKTSISIFCPI